MADSDRAATPDWMHRRTFPFRHMVPFLVCHLVVLGAFFTGVTWQAVALCAVLYFVRMFGVTAGYHRYFAHRSFKTSRVFQFVLAFIATSSAQKGALWWAAHHRRHHKYSDQEGDVHSPVREGFLWSHMGWLFVDGSEETDLARIRDFAKYPELRFLNRFQLLPPTLLALACLAIAGLPGLFIGFFLSTVLLWHGTFLINSLAHVVGSRRFETKDESRNNLWLALITLGEGWHNNHHRHQASCRQGFYWWEIDVTYYVLFLLSKVRIVWDLRAVPEKVLEEGRQADRERRRERRTAPAH
ncbi:MAG: acyl-CoA desaturase [Myxococcota bacterium]